MNEAGRKVRILRTNAELHQKELAEKVGLTSQVISNIERGYSEMNMEQAAKLAQGIRNKHLLAESQHKPPYSVCAVSKCMLPVLKALRDIRIAHYGTRYELREHGDIGRKVYRVLLGRGNAPVYIHGIAEYLEGIKADAYRQSYFK